MAPPPPELNPDAVSEILLRLPPEDPASLVRASAVCKPWLRTLTDPAFLRRYRAFHGTPRVLGFLHSRSIERFVPTTRFRPHAAAAAILRTCDAVFDCRHGRALLYDCGSKEFVVCDPVTGRERRMFDAVPDRYNYAVLCAAGAGCDHCNCSGGPFLLACAGVHSSHCDVFFARFYSSDTGTWSLETKLYMEDSQYQYYGYRLENQPAVLVGGALYYVCNFSILLRYDILGGQDLSVIKLPKANHFEIVIVIPAENSELGLASLYRNTLGYITSEYYSIGCLSECYNKPRNMSWCSAGSGCCEADVPIDMGYSRSYFNSEYNYTGCGYIAVMEEKMFSYSTTYRNSSTSFFDAYNGTVPVVMDWRIRRYTCEEAKLNSSSYACVSNNSQCVNTTNGPGYRCKCQDGYQGNPYVSDGCTDIDECVQDNMNDYCTARGATCQNTQGNFTCLCPPGKSMTNGICMAHHKSSSWLIPVVGASVGLVVLVVTLTCAYLIQQRKVHHTKQRYIQQYGDMRIFEKMKSQQGFKIFTEAQLQEATNKFNEKRVLGHGGQGTVYKGLVEGNVEVAVKRCMSVDEQHKREFGKEMLILSQINHKNIVKLLGCCLEVQVPMLVYEFIPNGTLFQLIHGNHGRQISLAIRIQIAHQSTEALAYLHSWASPPIFHGDVKSSNILIDRDYTAKVSDFGASILAPTDESQFVTFVQGTCGYLDPEYMQTCQLTDKSDVYSFGVVLLELLTRKKPFKFDGPEDEKSLAVRFISVAKQGKLEEILDDHIKNDESMEVLQEVAELAMQCLEMSGANRPTMKEVSERLDSLRKVMQHAQQQHNPEEMEPLLGESSLASSDEVVVSTGNLSIEMEAARSLERGR